jgi:hypothetical protein
MVVNPQHVQLRDRIHPGHLCGNANALSRREDYELSPDAPHIQQMTRRILVYSPNGYKIDPAITVHAIAVTAESNFISRVRSASANFLPTIADDPEYEIVDDLAYMDGLVVIPTLAL